LPGGKTPSSYDRSAGRWLEAAFDAISPDGKRYAYTEGIDPQQPTEKHRQHIVTISTGEDRVVYEQNFFDVTSWQPEGIYLVYHRGGTDASTGLWRVDPATAQLHQVNDGGSWSSVNHGAAWQSAGGDLGRLGGDTITRLDLATGKIVIWLHRPGRGLGVEGVDAGGRPFIGDYPPDGSPHAVYSYLSAPGRAQQIYPAAGLENGLVFYGVYGDSDRTWLSSEKDGIFTFTPATGLVPVGGTRFSSAPRFTGGCH
jgi:hypothetical protein